MFGGSNHRFDQGCPNTSVLQFAQSRHGRTARRGDHIFELSWMELLLIKQCSRSGQCPMSEPVGLIARQTSSDCAISHGFSHQSHVSRA